ncbi:MAG TPA: hypothetical protein VFJ63_05185 [Candidatus Bathyarchaeia archaeon]|nr:hypothetical protein [Candidatus Bathyarchaeia archaeon]
MSQLSADAKRRFEEKLVRALDEAWAKMNTALQIGPGDSREAEMSIWLAAEAAEYASFLFNATYDLDELDPKVKIKRGSDPLVLMKDSYESLRIARELREKSPTEAYTELRYAADRLKAAYLRKSDARSKRTR